MIAKAPPHAARIRGQEILARRMEFKYMVDRSIRTALAGDLLKLMRRDLYAGPDGCYQVRSLYFDTPDYMAYHEKLAGMPSRHKLRVRAYGQDPSATECVRLEVKSRRGSLIRKATIDLPREQYPPVAEALQNRRLPPLSLVASPNVPKEFFRLQRQFNMEPKVLIQYRREAFERTEVSRIRANFDDELLAADGTDVLGRLAAPRRLLRYGRAVFEIKVDGALPSWMHTLIAKYNLQNQPFSKYCHAVRSVARLSPALQAF